MARLLGGIGCLGLGSVGWWMGEPFGLFTAVVLSSIGSGLGLYLGRYIVRYYLG